MFRLFGRVNDDSNKLAGYVVLNVETNEAVPRPMYEVMAMLSANANFANAKLVNGKITGTEASLERLPVFSPQGDLKSNPRITILFEIFQGEKSTGFYVVLNSRAVRKVLSTDAVTEILQGQQATNAKLVPRGDKLVISAIQGHFDQIQATEIKKQLATPEAKKAVSKAVKTASDDLFGYNKKAFLAEHVEQLIRLSLRSNGVISHIPTKALKMLIYPARLEAFNVKSVKDIQRKHSPKSLSLSEAYNDLLDLTTYIEASQGANYTSGVAFEHVTNGERYKRELKGLIDLKREYNAELSKYNEHKAFLVALKNADKLDSEDNGLDEETVASYKAQLSKLEDIKRLKEAGEYLNCVEFRIYYHDKKGFPMKDAFFMDSKKTKLDNLKAKIIKKEEMYFKVKQDELLASNFPFFKDYVLRGKLDFTLKVLKNDKALLSKITSRKMLTDSLDILFILACKKRFERAMPNWISANRDLVKKSIFRAPSSARQALQSEINSIL